MKTQISVFPWAKIGQNDHSNPYIESTTVLSDIHVLLDVVRTYYVYVLIREYGSTLYIGIAMVFCVTFGPI